MLSFCRPLPAKCGTVSQWFGEHPEWYGRYGLPGHNGVDYAAMIGTPILAMHSGRVEVGDDPGGYGRYVKVIAEGYYTLYGHMSASLVVDGQHVNQCEQIGNVGNTGNSTGPHVHVGLRMTGKHGDMSGYNGWANFVPFRDMECPF